MSRNSVAHLFKEPAQWPLIPPWWLVSAPQAAALLNIKPATLQSWRIRGEGPEPVPPMYLHPTQGNPVYYRYGDIREWAASRVGLSFPFEDQCIAFLQEVEPWLGETEWPVGGLALSFDILYRDERKLVQQGEDPHRLDRKLIETLDTFYSRQPRFKNPKKKPSLYGPYHWAAA
jgi:hypothetical protein